MKIEGTASSVKLNGQELSQPQEFVAYIETSCKHCHATVMLDPAQIDARKVAPRCPYCQAPKLRPTDLALMGKETEQGYAVRLARLER